MHRYFSILGLIIILLAFLLPAAIPQHSEASVQTVVLDNGVTTQYLGGNKWRAEIGLPKYLDDLKTPIECRWVWNSQFSEWETAPNLYSARVYQTTTWVEYEDDAGHTQELSWRPDIYIGGGLKNPTSNQLLLDDPLNEYYHGNILEWTYPNGIARHLRIIEGTLIENFYITEVPSGNIVIKPHINRDAGFVWTRPTVAWDAEGKIVNLVIDPVDSGVTLALADIQAATLPITIDPESTFTTSSSDGYFENYGSASYSTLHDATSASDVFDSRTYFVVGQYSYGYAQEIRRAFVYFDTSNLPDDAVVTDAKLRLRCSSVNLVDAPFYVEFTDDGGSGTYPHDPMVVGDYAYTHYNTSGYGGRISATSVIDEAYCELSANQAGRDMINLSGDTKLMVWSSEDRLDSEPAEDVGESISFYAYERGSGYEPELWVEYEIIVNAPTVTTENPSNVYENVATIAGYLNDDGGEPCSVKFEYGQTTSYGSPTTWQTGKTTGTSFSDLATGLLEGTVYHYRAMASNSNATVGYGADKSFLTKPDPPTNAKATATSGQVALSWTKGAGAGRTIIYFSTSSFPNPVVSTGIGTETISCADGTQVYFGTGSTYTHTGLADGTTYYYTMVSEITSSAMTRYSQYSDSAYGTPQALDDPIVRTDGVTSVGDTTATLHGYLLDMGGYASCNVSFQYRLGYTGAWTNTTPVEAMTAIGPYDKDITGLTAASTYTYRAMATNAHGTDYGSEEAFDTSGTSAPIMDTTSATNVDMTSAVLHGFVISDGGLSVTGWFVWGRTSACADGETGSASGLITGSEITYEISGLTKETDYYYMVVGENEKGRTYGDVVSFRTSAPDVPVVETKDASKIGSYTATLNGLLVDDGEQVCDVRFAWGTTTACSNSTVWQAGKRKADVFEASIGNLVVGQTYYFKAEARNDGTIASGSIKSFKTQFGAPADFEAQALSSTTIRVTWTPRGDQTYVVWSTSSYPANRNVGSLLYFGPDSLVTHQQCVAGQTYYYRAWSWMEDGTFSTAYSDTMATALAKGTQEEEMPDYIGPVEAPDRWTDEPAYAHLSKIPLYTIINDAADAFEMPYGTFWLILAIMLAIGLGLGTYFTTHTDWLAVLATGLGFGIGYWLMIIPLWMLFVYVMAGGGIMYVMKRA